MFPQLTQIVFVIADRCLMNSHLTAVITSVWLRNFTSLVQGCQIQYQKQGIVQAVICYHNSRQKQAKKACDSSSYNDEAMKLKSVGIFGKKANMTDNLLKCHNSDCKNGRFFHLRCLNYRRVPNNNRTTWMCRNCKVSRTYQPAVQGPSQTSQQTEKTPATTCSSFNLPPPQSLSKANIAPKTLKVMTPVMMKFK